jgi:hypothetical protein
MVNTYTGPNKGVCVWVEMLLQALMAFICYKTKENEYPSKWYLIEYIIMCDQNKTKQKKKQTKGVLASHGSRTKLCPTLWL